MFRSLILLIAIGLIVWIISSMLKKRLSGSAPSKKPARTSDSDIKSIVQCEQCKAFIPEDKAVITDGKKFCSQQHLEDWKNTQ